MNGTALVLAALLGAIAVPAVLWATSRGNVDTKFSGCLWTLILVGVVVGVIWGLGAWVARG